MQSFGAKQGVPQKISSVTTRCLQAQMSPPSAVIPASQLIAQEVSNFKLIFLKEMTPTVLSLILFSRNSAMQGRMYT